MFFFVVVVCFYLNVMNGLSAEWEKLFANDMTDKDLIFQNI